MATVTAFEPGRPARRGFEAGKVPAPASRGLIGAVLFLLVAFFLLAAGAASGAPAGGGAPVETGAFVLDPAIGSARS